MYCTQCIYLYNALAYAYILCSNKTTSSYTRDAARDNAKSLLAFHWVRGHNENFFFFMNYLLFKRRANSRALSDVSSA